MEIPNDMVENFWCFLIALLMVGLISRCFLIVELTPIFPDGGVNFLDFLMKGLNV